MNLFKKITSFVILLSVSLQMNAQSALQGQSIIDTYYGFPNLYTLTLKTLLKAEIFDGTELDIKTGSLGPAGFYYEYVVADNIGIGIDTRYATSSVTYQRNTDVLGNAGEFNYKITAVRWGVLGRFNYHFGSNEKLDPYITVGLGYSSNVFKWATNDTNFREAQNGKIPIPLPLAFRGALGLRYFFIPNLGLNLEIGAFGALIRGGLSFRFGGGAAE